VAHHRPTRQARIRRRRAVAALIVLAAFSAALGDWWPASEPSVATPAPLAHVAASAAPPRLLGEADGAIPDGTTVFDDDVPGVAKLAPALLSALRQAAGDATGVQFTVDSGWRSRAYQQHLLEDAVAQYGSTQEAARWVATPETSAHVSGDAVDLGSTAAQWLSRYGAAYGLCRIYGNEPWHFELRPAAIARGCPQMYADPTHDPRMQQ